MASLDISSIKASWPSPLGIVAQQALTAAFSIKTAYLCGMQYSPLHVNVSAACMVIARAGGRVVASPYARKLAHEAGVDISQAQATGPGGRIVAADVQKLISSGGGKGEQPSAGAAPQVCCTA